MSDMMQARDLAELGFLKQYLEEQEVPAELLEPSADLPIGALVVPLLQDEQGRDRFLTCSFVPLSEEDIPGLRLLQLYAVVPASWKEGTRMDVERLLHAVNGRTAIGHFGIKEDGEVHFRYVYSLSDASVLPKAETLGTIDLFHLMLDTFADLIDGVASGETSLSEALRYLE